MMCARHCLPDTCAIWQANEQDLGKDEGNDILLAACILECKWGLTPVIIPCGLASLSRSTGPTSGRARASPRQRATTRLRRTASSALDSSASRRLHGRAGLSQL